MRRVWEKVRSWSPWVWVFVVVATVVVVSDQVSKWHAVSHLTDLFTPLSGPGEPLAFGDKLSRFLWHKSPAPTAPIAVLDDFWHFRYVENPGAAWGFLSRNDSALRTPFFLAVSLAAMVFIVVYYRKTAVGQRFLRVALALVFGGALGNFVDRVRLGYVIDFIDWHWYDLATWPTFNIADSAISVGVVLMVIDMLLARSSEAQAGPEKGRVIS